MQGEEEYLFSKKNYFVATGVDRAHKLEDLLYHLVSKTDSISTARCATFFVPYGNEGN
jgi:hypothetical protein